VPRGTGGLVMITIVGADGSRTAAEILGTLAAYCQRISDSGH
jgi:hypothetical protein